MADDADMLTKGRHDSSLMIGRRVAKAHGHHAPFVRTEGCCDGGFVDVVWMDACLKKTIGHVDCRPDLAFPAVCKDLSNSGEWVVVGYSICIQLSIITDPTRYGLRVFFW